MTITNRYSSILSTSHRMSGLCRMRSKIGISSCINPISSVILYGIWTSYICSSTNRTSTTKCYQSSILSTSSRYVTRIMRKISNFCPTCSIKFFCMSTTRMRCGYIGKTSSINTSSLSSKTSTISSSIIKVSTFCPTCSIIIFCFTRKSIW